MPRIDVRCESDHITEVDRPLAMYPATPPCPTCAAPTTQIHLPPRTRWSLDPVVVYRAADGTFRFPGDSNGPGSAKYDRAGLERIELRSAADVRRFESQMNAREYSRAARRVERMCQLREQRESASRSALRQQMQSMSEFGKAVARAAIARNNAKPGLRASDSGFHIDVFSNDRGSRDDSRRADGKRHRD